MVAGACSGDSTPSASLPTAPATTSTVPPPVTEPTTTTVVVGSVTPTTVAPAPAPASSPEDRARAFYEAWTRGDRAAAATLGEAEAVATLFGRTWSAGDGWVFAECSGAAGSVICGWDSPSAQLLMRVESASGDRPVTVSEVRFG